MRDDSRVMGTAESEQQVQDALRLMLLPTPH